MLNMYHRRDFIACAQLVLVLLPALLSKAVAQNIEYVQDADDFLLALNSSSVSEIRLNTTLIGITAVNFPANTTVRIFRNITVTRAESLKSGLPVLSFSKDLFAKIKLGEGVWMTMREIEFLGMHKLSSSSPTRDSSEVIAMNGQDTAILFKDSLLTNLVCPPLNQYLSGINNTRRPYDMSGPQEIVSEAPGSCMSSWGWKLPAPRCFPGVALVQDWAYRPALVGSQGGYLLMMRNVTLACSAVVPDDCLKTQDLPTCMAAQLASVDPLTGKPLPSLMSSVAKDNASGDVERPSLLPMILGAVFGVTGALAMAGGALFWYHKRQEQIQRQRRHASRKHSDKHDGQSDLLGTTSSNLVGGEDPNELKLGMLIGCGSFGRVYAGRWRGRDVAVKKILHSGEELIKIQRELRLSMGLAHPNIVESVDAFEVDALNPSSSNGSGGGDPVNDDVAQGASSEALKSLHRSDYMFPSANPTTGHGRSARKLNMETWLIQELCDQGPLSTALYSGRFMELSSTIPVMNALLLRARDIAAGMEYLHARGICHGDLKSENILLQSDIDDPYQCKSKICDFGLSKALSEGRSHVTSRHFGTITHMSPEILVSGQLRPACDVYSFGVLLWEMVTGSRPYAGLTQGEIVHRIVVEQQRLAFPPRTHQGLRDLAARCWLTDPDARPTFKHVKDSLTKLMQDVDANLVRKLTETTWKLQDSALEAAADAPGLYHPNDNPVDLSNDITLAGNTAGVPLSYGVDFVDHDILDILSGPSIKENASHVHADVSKQVHSNPKLGPGVQVISGFSLSMPARSDQITADAQQTQHDIECGVRIMNDSTNRAELEMQNQPVQMKDLRNHGVRSRSKRGSSSAQMGSPSGLACFPSRDHSAGTRSLRVSVDVSAAAAPAAVGQRASFTAEGQQAPQPHKFVMHIMPLVDMGSFDA